MSCGGPQWVDCCLGRFAPTADIRFWRRMADMGPEGHWRIFVWADGKADIDLHCVQRHFQPKAAIHPACSMQLCGLSIRPFNA